MGTEVSSIPKQTFDAAAITSGTIADARIPSIDTLTGAYNDAAALAAAKAGGLNKAVWLATAIREITDADRTTTLAFTDLDLTADTSTDAKYAILMLGIVIDSITAGSANNAKIELRKNGDTPAYYMIHQADGSWAVATTVVSALAIVALDGDEVMEYQLVIGGTCQADFYIDLLGYIE